MNNPNTTSRETTNNVTATEKTAEKKGRLTAAEVLERAKTNDEYLLNRIRLLEANLAKASECIATLTARVKALESKSAEPSVKQMTAQSDALFPNNAFETIQRLGGLKPIERRTSVNSGKDYWLAKPVNFLQGNDWTTFKAAVAVFGGTYNKVCKGFTFKTEPVFK